jgi:hypothetical protein
MNLDDETPFQEKLPMLKVAPAPSATLESQIARLAQKHRPRRALALGLTVGGLVATGALIGFVFAPRMALAGVLRDAEKSLSADSLHTRMYALIQGKPQLFQELWYEKGKIRDEVYFGERALQIVEGGRRWYYRPGMKLVTWQKDSYTSTQLANSRESAHKAQEAGRRLIRRPPGVVDEGEVLRDGRRFRRLVEESSVQNPLSSKMEKRRTIEWVDIERRRVDRVEIQALKDGVWETQTRLDYDWHRPFPSATFDTRFPGAKIYEWDRFGEAAGKRFTKPLATKTFASRTIALRDVQVNARGDVFVLFTDGSREKKRHTEESNLSLGHTSSRESPYIHATSAMEPYMEVTNGKDRGLTVSGEVVQGACFILKKPLTGPWKPQTFDITIHFNEQDSKDKTIYHTRWAHFPVTITRPKTPLLPDYADALRVLDLAGGDKAHFEGQRVFYQQWIAEQEERWADLLSLAQQSLKYYAKNEEPVLQRFGYELKARVYEIQSLRHLGRLTEARRALEAIPIPGAKETQEVRDEAAKLRRAEQGKPEPGD